MTIRYNGCPVVGFGVSEMPTPPTVVPKASPWPMVLASSVVSAAAGWAIDEIAHRVRGKRRR
jgi:hypothetical protein